MWQQKNNILLCAFLATIIALISYAAGYYISKDHYSVPRNCTEIAHAYLEMGKKYYGLDSRKQSEWEKAIDKETYIQNFCLEQFPKQYPWDYKR